MNWDAVGALSELVGAIGVIASLFYLGSQIRRNSTALEAATNQSVTDSTQTRLLAPAQNESLARAVARARSNYRDLTETERVQLNFFSRATFRGVQNAFIQCEQGLLPAEGWSEYESIIRLNVRRPDVPDWWPTERDTYQPDFAAHVDRVISEEAAAGRLHPDTERVPAPGR